MAYGNEGFLGVAKQNSYGSVASVYHFIPFVSEGLATTKELLMQESILARYDEAAPVAGMESVEGDISMELNPIDAGPFLLGVCGSVTVTEPLSGTVFLHTFKLTQERFDANLALRPYSLQVYRGVEEAFQFTDGQVNTLEISVAAGGFAKMNVGVICRTTSLMTKGTASYYPAVAFTWDQASLQVGSAAINDFEEITFSINNALSGISLLDGTTRRGRIQRDGYREIRVSGTLDLPDLDEYDIFIAQTNRQLTLHLQKDTEMSSGYPEYITIDVPNFRYEAFPINIGGPGRISVGFTGRGIYDTTSLYSLEINVQNSLSAY